MTRKKHAEQTPPQEEITESANEEARTDGSAASAEENSPQTVASDDQGSQIETRIVELEKELAEERSRALRVLADFQNYRRRNEEQRGEMVRYAVQELVTDLLPALDNLERALGADSDSSSFEALQSGVELTRKQILDVLKRYGVEPIAAVGSEFDPNLHEAVMRVEDTEQPENTVVEEMRRGYTMHNRVIRPSMVKVSARP
jgi:molecular chaperone GrpE